MINFNIFDEDTKKFMNILIKEELFDKFEVRGIEILTFTKIEVTGILDKDYFSSENDEEIVERNYCTWAELRPYIFNIIKGSQKPKSIKIIFSLAKSKLFKIHENTSAAFLNMVFENGTVNFTTATGQKNFSIDKSMDMVWDEYVLKFFKVNNISVIVN